MLGTATAWGPALPLSTSTQFPFQTTCRGFRLFRMLLQSGAHAADYFAAPLVLRPGQPALKSAEQFHVLGLLPNLRAQLLDSDNCLSKRHAFSDDLFDYPLLAVLEALDDAEEDVEAHAVFSLHDQIPVPVKLSLGIRCLDKKDRAKCP